MNEHEVETVSEEESANETTNVIVLTVQVVETANKVDDKDTTVVEETIINKEVTKSKLNVAGRATDPAIEVDDGLCTNNYFEANLSSICSYCAAAAAAVPIRKLGGVNYSQCIHQTQNEDRKGSGSFFPSLVSDTNIYTWCFFLTLFKLLKEIKIRSSP